MASRLRTNVKIFRSGGSGRFFYFLVVHYSVVYLVTWVVTDRLGVKNQSSEILIFIIGLISLVSTLSYNVRRLHDSNRSGILCAGYFLFVAPVVILVSLLLPPRNAGNRHGPDPRSDQCI
ncbi:DUF805 domain-containing protein [Trinickia terrae]|uniref:DUF805 domain-containing protein n=1 Tax=Trinickia terrae TaxID=2571161 RepID=A0A4V5PG52_9BURK|nr:DUF805 domain-containing protein [Trinickia terrae]